MHPAPPTRLLTRNDAFVAAAILREDHAGNRGAAFALATRGNLTGITNRDLERLCAAFGVEVHPVAHHAAA